MSLKRAFFCAKTKQLAIDGTNAGAEKGHFFSSSKRKLNGNKDFFAFKRAVVNTNTLHRKI